jgi:glycosyltransferase involved in cell wall biosynthesis
MNICHVVYSFYEKDSRVRMYAEALAGRGDHVDVIALRNNGKAEYEILKGVHVHRIQLRIVNEQSKATFLYRLLKFFTKSAAFLARRTLNGAGPYDLIHVHSVPDFEVFATLIPKLAGTKIILDIHDIVPEFYQSKFGVSTDSFIFKGLMCAERASTAFADHVIIANHLWEKIITGRSVNKEKCTTFLNYPAPAYFQRYPKTRNDAKVRLIYPGSLNMHQGVDIAVRAFDRIKAKAPEAEMYVYGDGPSRDALWKLVAAMNIEARVFLRDALPLEEIVPIVAEADIGIVPKRAESFGDMAFSTKIFEFMALKVPAIVSKTTIDSHYFNDSVVKFFKPGDVDGLAEAMLELIKDRQQRVILAQKATAFIKEYAWEMKKEEYLRLADNLTGHEKVTSNQ